MFRLGGQLRIGKKAVDPKSVAHIHDDHALPGKSLSAVISVPGLSGLERTAMDIDEHRQVLCTARRSPDIKIKRILARDIPEIIVQRHLIIVIADDLGKRAVQRGVLRLHTHRGKMIHRPHAFPGCRNLRLLPAKLAHRRRRVGNPGKDLDLTVCRADACELPLLNCYDLRNARVFALHRRAELFGTRGKDHDSCQHRGQSKPAGPAYIPWLIQQISVPYKRKHPQRQHQKYPGCDAVFIQLKKNCKKYGYKCQNQHSRSAPFILSYFMKLTCNKATNCLPHYFLTINFLITNAPPFTYHGRSARSASRSFSRMGIS